MAGVAVVIEGLPALREAVQRAGPEIEKQVNQQLQAGVAPIVANAKSRMSALPGTGKLAADGITGGVLKDGVVYVRLGQREHGYIFPREFGGPKQVRTSVYQMKGGGYARGWTGTVTRRVNYALPSQFGPWTGNQFTIQPGERVAGHAFYPAAHDGFIELSARIEQLTDQLLRDLDK